VSKNIFQIVDPHVSANPGDSLFGQSALPALATPVVIDSSYIKNKPVYAQSDSSEYLINQVFPNQLQIYPTNKKKVYLTSDSTNLNLLKTSTYHSFHQAPKDFSKALSYNTSLWFLSSILICLLMFTWMKFFFNKYIIQVITALFNPSQLSRMFQDKNLVSDRLYMFLNLFFFLSGGLFLFQCIHLYFSEHVHVDDITLYLICIVALLSLFSIRYVLNSVLGFFINKKQLMKEYLHTVFMLYKFYGIILFPIVILIAYVQANAQTELMMFSFALLLITYLLRLFFGLHLLYKKGFLLFYTILYLCTIEILPLLLLYKLLIMQ
jgi:hypothetical protein